MLVQRHGYIQISRKSYETLQGFELGKDFIFDFFGRDFDFLSFCQLAECHRGLDSLDRFWHKVEFDLFAGFADPAINSNGKIANPNINVLEYANRQPAFSGKVAAFATWDVMEFILNRERSRLPLQVGWTEIDDPPLTAGQREVNTLVQQQNTFNRDVARALTELAAQETRVAQLEKRLAALEERLKDAS